MPLTPNLGLKTINRAQEAGTKLVTEWIDDISGNESSNMTILDTEINKKLNKADLINNLTQATPGVGALDAYQGKVLDEGKTKRINLTGQLQKVGYQRSVIALCELTNIPNFFSASNGFLSLSRTNGNGAGVFVEVSMQRAYTTGVEKVSCNYKVTSGTYELIKPCRFKYNGILYGGLDIYRLNKP